MRVFYLLFLFVIINQSTFARAVEYHNKRIERGIVSNPHKKSNQLEFYMLKPSGEGPFPIMFLLHGYQPSDSSVGGKQLVDYGYLERFEKIGVIAVSISVPGYGNSDGERDFGGVESQNAIIAIIDHFKTLSFVNGAKMGVYGISRGAQLAGMVSSCYSTLSLQILESGFYDLVSFDAGIPAYLEGIQNSMIEEGGDSLEALIERSPLYHTDSTNAATLILQGEFDDRRQLPAAQKMHDLLSKRGVESKFKIYPDACHDLPVDKWEAIISFIREHFYDLYGIGIKVSEAMPAMQILKIFPDSPASHSGKLRIGDAVLSISPENDDLKIATLRMPVGNFISLMLGSKNSSLRLRVQHFDLSIEDVVIERGSFFVP